MQALAPTKDEAPRQAMLQRLGLIGSAREAGFDGLVECAAQALQTPAALISLVDGRRLWFKAAVGVDLTGAERERSFCAYAIEGDALFEVEDARADARFADHPWVTGDAQIRFYAGQPLRVLGVTLGTLCVVDRRPRRLSDAQRRVLANLVAAASELLSGRARLAELQHESERQRDFAASASDWTWELDADLRYTDVSAGLRAVTGESPEALIGQPVADAPLLDEQGRPQPGGWRRLLQRGEAFSRMVIEVEAGGRLLHLSCSARPRHDDAQRLLGWRGVSRDVTAVSKSDLWARRQELLLRKITANVPGVIFQARQRADGLPQFLYLSPAAPMLFGFSPEAALADPRLIVSRVHRDDLAGVLAQFVAANRQLAAWHSEYRMVMPGKRIVWVETRALPEATAEGVIWSGYTADISERKRVELALRQAEQTWELAADADGLGIAHLDLASGRLHLDRRACANHGLAFPQPDYRLDDWIAGIDPDDRASARAALEQAIEHRCKAVAQVRVRWADGRQRMLEFVAAPSYGSDGRAVALTGTCRDVTERLSMERLRREKEAADSASRAKSEFLSRVSHELRTPLNSILGFTQLLALDTAHPLHPDQQRQMAIVQHAGRHLLGQIEALLDLSRIENRERVLNLRSVELTAALGRCLDVLAPMAARAGVRLPAAPQHPIAVHADTRALEQVLMNLLSNAIKYNRRGGAVEIDIDVHGGRVAIAVSDQGTGMSEAQRERLFTPFDRLDAKHTPVEGSGLGLVIVRELAHAMAGELEVSSAPDTGSTFTLSLQLSDAEPTTSPGLLTTLGIDLAARAGDEPRRVFYVEDEPLNVLLMQEVVRRVPPWQLGVAATGAEGLAAVRTAPPDLLLIDINLPDMTGIDLVRALRADPATAALRCIALSADAMSEQVDAALAAGFDDYWLKPIDVPQLIDRLSRLTSTAPRRYS